MSHQNKSKENLIIELEQLQQKYDSLIGINEQSASEQKDKQIDLKLQISEMQKKMILDGITSNIAFVDKDLKIIWANKTAAESVNKSSEEMVGQTCHHFWANSNEPCKNCPSIKALNSKKSEQSIMHTPDGRVWEEIGEPVFDEEGNIIGVVEIATDITKRVLADKLLVESEQRYRSLFDNMLNGFAHCQMFYDDAGKPVDYIHIAVNKAFLAQTGLKDVVGKKISEIIPGIRQADDELFEIYGRVAINGVAEHFEMYIASLDNWFAISVYSPLKDQFVVIFDNITLRKKTEEALRDNEKKYRLIAENTADVIWSMDLNLNTTFVSPSVFKLRGFTSEEAIKQSAGQYLTPDSLQKMYKVFEEQMFRIKNNLPLEQNSIIEEFEQYKKDGSIILTENTISIIYDDNKNPIGILGITRDITKRKKAEHEIELKNQELQKINAEKDKFFSIISHDLRTPFNGFLGLSQLIAEKSSSLTINEIQDIAEDMRKSAANLFRLLENLLQWARMQKGALPFNPEVVKLRPIVNDCITLITVTVKSKEIEITCDIPDELEVFADINMLETVVRNLVSNAIKFTPRHGKVSVNAHINNYKNVEITVADSGIGMSSEIVTNLFRIDVQTNRIGTEGEPSTGLGLLLCKEFVEKHGGKIWVESKEANLAANSNGGSVFCFTIPCYNIIESKTNLNDIESVEAQNPINNLKILIAEDDEVSEKLISRVVNTFSREISIAKNGIEAVEACRNNPDIDLVMMDIKMPEMDGYEATRQIRLFNKDIVIIAQTAYAMSSARDMAIKAGCNDYISKPINHLLLEELIEKYFKK
jgi:PAS domain S-box-containing protein